MKKVLVLLVALLLAIPVIGHAGSATSRYDVTIGGYIKFDMGYNTQDTNEAASTALRSSTHARKDLYDEYGNTFMSSADTTISLLVKGPDAFGAKTSGLVAFNFRGVNTGNAFGGAQILFAWMKLKWASSELTIGKDFQQFGMPYTKAALGIGDFGQYLSGGPIPPAVTLRYEFLKNWNFMLGVISPTEWTGAGSTRQYNDDYARGELPFLEYELEYKNEGCGKVGPNPLRFAVGGLFGREQKTNTLYYSGLDYKASVVPVWIVAGRYFVPIIPEKQGNKKNALYLTGNAFLGQNFGGDNWLGIPNAPSSTPGSMGSYWRGGVNSKGVATWGFKDAAAPTAFGMFAQLSYYFTDQVSINGMYGYLKYNYSDWAKSTPAISTADYKGANCVNMNQNYAISVLYDPTPNLRLGAQWMRMFTRFNGDSNTTLIPNSALATAGTGLLDKSGYLDMYRVAAWYFF